MKILKWIVLAALCAQPAVACDFCAVYSATQARGDIGKGFYAGLAQQFTRFGTMQDEGKEVSNPTGQYLNSSISQLFGGYYLNKQFSLQLNLPIIYRSFKRPEGFEIDRGTESGIGDMSLIAQYLVYRHLTEDSTQLVQLFGGVKFPTGNPDRIKEEFDEVEVPGAPESGIHGHDLTLGSGSWDGLVGGTFYFRCHRFFFNATAQYSIRTEGAFGYQFANDLTWSGGPGALLVLNEEFTLALEANVSGETKGKDTFQGEKAADTGITSVYVGPVLTATWRENLSVEAGVDIPVSIDNTSLQAVPDYRIHAAFTWHF